MVNTYTAGHTHYTKKPKTKSKLNIFIISLMLCVFIIPNVLAVNTFSNTFDSQQSNGNFNIYTDLDDTVTLNEYTATGYDRLKIFDINSDTVKEAVMFDINGSYLYVASASNNAYEETTQYSLPSGYRVLDLVVYPNADRSDNRILAVLETNTNTVLAYMSVSGTALTISDIHFSTTDDFTPLSDIECSVRSQSGNTIADCFYSVDNGTHDFIWFQERNSNQNTYVIDAENGIANNTDFYTMKGTNNLDNPSIERYPIAVSRFGNEFAYYSAEGSGNRGIALIDVSDGASCPTSSIETITTNVFSINCTKTWHSDVYIGTTWYGSADVYTIQDASFNDYYCITGYQNNGGNYISASCYSDSGALLNAHQATISISADTTPAFTHAIGDFTGDGNEDVCYGVSTNAGTNIGYLRCHDMINDVGIYDQSSTGQVNAEHVLNTARINFSDMAIISEGGNNISLLNDTDVLDIESTIDTIDGVVLLDDITGDGIAEYISNDFYVGFTESASASTITLYSPFVFGYYEPQCTNQTATFKMRECQGTLDCTYTTSNADITETEYVCSTCAGTEGWDNCGVNALVSPQVLCDDINTTGTKEIAFRMFTSASTGIATQFNKNVTFADTSCNIEADIVTPPTVGGGDGTNQTDGETDSDTVIDADNPDSLIEGLLPNSTLWRIVIGACIVLGLLVSVVSYTGRETPPVLMGIVALISMILVTALGFFPVYILIIAIVGVVLMIILQKYVGGD
jgi:hypothetical protein